MCTDRSKTALAAVKAQVGVLTQGNTHQSLANLLQRVNPVLRGWANYFRHGVSARTFDHLSPWSWWRVVNCSVTSIPGPTGGGSVGATCQGGGQQTAR